MAIMGKNIWDNLTAGMYLDSRIIFREYIQNACDSIDDAQSEGLLGESDGLIEIILDNKKRYISIKDNGAGINREEFKSKVGNVADSDKEIGSAKGFRGIGRLCGLAYCENVVFSSKSRGESTVSIMSLDANALRYLLYEDKTKYTFEEVYEKIVSFSTENSSNIDEHFFKVELFDVRKSNTALLNKQGILDYLSLVAPVPYINSFIYSAKIYEHAKRVGAKLDEYKVLVNGEQVLKNYKTYLYKNERKNDEISDILFQDFYDENNNLIAWLWYGLSTFNGALDKTNHARYLRLRKENIQIGGPETLNGLFNESRGNKYFVGEVFAVSKQLIPNSQRDNFNENDMRIFFEESLKDFFKNTLSKLYHSASNVRGHYDKIANYVQARKEFEENGAKNKFINSLEKEKAEKSLETKKLASEKAQKDLGRFELNHPKETAPAMVAARLKALYMDTCKEALPEIVEGNERKKEKAGYITSDLPLDRKGRKLVTQIYQIITDFFDKDESRAKELIEKIQEGLK